MNVQLDELSPVKAVLTIDLVESDYADKVKKQLKEIGTKQQIPGFRKGHVPFPILEKRFGKDVASDVINNEVYDATMNYLRDNKINVLGYPVPMDVTSIDLDKNKDYSFKYELAIAPKIDVTIDKEVKLPYYVITVSDDMINEQDSNLRKRFGAQVPGEEVEPDALVKGSIMELNEDGTVKESEDAIQVIAGIVSPQHFTSKEQTEKFIGKKVGDKVVFNPWNTCDGNVIELASMLNINKERAADVKGDFEMAISEIIVLRPAELGEEFYTNVFGPGKVSDEEQYRAAVRDMIAQQLAGNSEQIFQDDAFRYFNDKYAPGVELAADVLAKWLMRQHDITAEEADKEMERELPSLKWQLIRDAMAEKLGVTVEESDILSFATMLARQQFAQYGMSNLSDDVYVDYAKRMLADKNINDRIYSQVSTVKLFHAVKDAVTIEAKEMSLDEFKAMVEERSAKNNTEEGAEEA